MKSNSFEICDYMYTIHLSWTWERMTKAEQKACNELFYSPSTIQAVKGTKTQRNRICQAIYHAFLIGLGYTDGFWREPENNEVPKF